MIRTLMALAALASVPAAAAGQAAPDAAVGAAGVTVHAPPETVYTIRLNVTGKAEDEIRRLIHRASISVCDRANAVAQGNPVYAPRCVEAANENGLRQLASLMEQRAQGLPGPVAITTSIVIR